MLGEWRPCRWKYPRTAQKSPGKRFGLGVGDKLPGTVISSLLGLPVAFSRIGLGPLPASCHPLEAVFWVFYGFAAVPSRDRYRLLASGVGLGGGYCTPPNRRDVSEANSLIVAPQQSYPQAWPVFLSSVCSLCSARAIIKCAASKSEKFNWKSEKFNWKSEKFNWKSEKKIF